MQKTTFFLKTFLIVGISLSALSVYSETKRCNSQDYDPETQECCSVLIGRSTYKSQPVPKGKCCGGYILSDSQECCNNEPLEKGKCAVFKGKQYDSSKRGICNGSLYTFKELDSSPGYTEMCCNGKVYPATVAGFEFECCFGFPMMPKGTCAGTCKDLKSTEGCCNSKPYDLSTQECCGGSIVDKGKCCAGVELKGGQECCSGAIVASGECCEGLVLKAGETCQSRTPLEGEKLPCGGLLQYDPETQQCCNGNQVISKDETCVAITLPSTTDLKKNESDVLPQETPKEKAKVTAGSNIGLCGSLTYISTTHKCCNGTIVSNDAECPVITPSIGAPIKENPFTQGTIQEQTVQENPNVVSFKENLCGSFSYDPETQQCCNGKDIISKEGKCPVITVSPVLDSVEKRNVMQQTQREVTVPEAPKVNTVSVVPTQTVPVAKSTVGAKIKLCGGKSYNAKTQRCCNGTIIEKTEKCTVKRPTGAAKSVL